MATLKKRLESALEGGVCCQGYRHSPGQRERWALGEVSIPALNPDPDWRPVAEELPPAAEHVYALVRHAEPSRPPQKYVQTRDLLRRQAPLAGGVGLAVAGGSMQVMAYLGERGVYSLRLWEVLVVLRDWHTERVVEFGVGGTLGEQARDGEEPQWDEVELWSASRQKAGAQFLRFTLEVLVGTKGDGGTHCHPLLQTYSDRVWMILRDWYCNMLRLVLVYFRGGF